MTRVPAIQTLAREGRLYPSTLLHGATAEVRLEEALDLTRVLLCARDGRPGGDCDCTHCRRISADPEGAFHPDLHLLRRDLKTSTSADSTREVLREARLRPFEARGQVFIVCEAESLTDEAASALLKILEEPPTSAPRNFFLLCPGAEMLLPTIRSRSMAVYLGSSGEIDPEGVAELAETVGGLLDAYSRGRSPAHLLALAQVLFESAKWEDPRSGAPWASVAATVVEAHRRGLVPAGYRRAALDLAADLIGQGPLIRVRMVPVLRILEGLVSRHLSRPPVA